MLSGLTRGSTAAGTITTQTALVLANALYLEARWANPFTRSQTIRGPFYPTTAGPAARTREPVAVRAALTGR